MNLMKEFNKMILKWQKEQFGDKRWILKLQPKSIKTLCKGSEMKAIVEQRALKAQSLKRRSNRNTKESTFISDDGIEYKYQLVCLLFMN